MASIRREIRIDARPEKVEVAPAIGAMIEQGMGAMKKTLER